MFAYGLGAPAEALLIYGPDPSEIARHVRASEDAADYIVISSRALGRNELALQQTTRFELIIHPATLGRWVSPAAQSSHDRRRGDPNEQL
jgi:hypothetical protein